MDAKLLKTLRESRSYWDRPTVDLMYREQKHQPTDYNLVTLKTAFFIFLGLLLFHAITIFILKMIVSSHFKETSWFNKIGHVVESLNVPDVYKDFDIDLDPEEEKTPEDYKEAYNSVLKETLWMTSLQMVSNLILLVPLLVAGDKNTIGDGGSTAL